MAESASAPCENAISDSGPTTSQKPSAAAGFSKKSSGADNLEGGCATKSDSRGKVETVTSEQVERKGRQGQFSKRQGREQSRWSDARKREVFEVPSGGRWREKPRQRWRNEEGDRGRREKREGVGERDGEVKFDMRSGRQEHSGRIRKERGEEGDKETKSRQEQHERGEKNNEVSDKSRQSEYGGRRRGRGRGRGRRDEQTDREGEGREKGEGEKERVDEGQLKLRQRDRRERGERKAEIKQENKKQDNEERQGVTESRNKVKSENSVPSDEAKRTENSTNNEKGASEGSNSRKPPRHRRQLKETQVRERQPRDYDRDWRGRSDGTETERGQVSERRYMYAMSVPEQRVRNRNDGRGGEETKSQREGEGVKRQGWSREGGEGEGVKRQGWSREGGEGEGVKTQGWSREGGEGEGVKRQGWSREGGEGEGVKRQGWSSEGGAGEGVKRQGWSREGGEGEGVKRQGWSRERGEGEGVKRQGWSREGGEGEGVKRQGWSREGGEGEGVKRQGWSREGGEGEGVKRQGWSREGGEGEGVKRQGWSREGGEGEGVKRQVWSREGGEGEGDKRGQQKKSGRSVIHKKGKGKKIAPSLQSSELTEQLSSGAYTCMVCCDRVRDRDTVWSCRECYHVFHLSCIGKWATAPASLMNEKEPSEGWRCPACQNPSDVIPTVYKCYCGKITNPRPRARGELTVPHSCRELCGRSLARGPSSSCQHKCQLLCHPGPCPPCPVMVTRSCPCGRQNFQVRCSKGEELPSCGSECRRRLKCGRHHCKQPCHSGSCGDCGIMLSQHCHCGRSQREVVCGDSGEKGEEERYGCHLNCGRELNCGNHLCELTCHPAPCPPCPLLPSHITTCPCGAMPLSALLSPDQSRTSCLDPVPTCDRSCGKVLPCSTKAEPHFCPAVCHEGPCPPCEKSRLLRCLCGRGSTRVDCQLLEGAGDFVCDKPCNKMKSCGRHRCNTRCCVDTNHQCNLVCGKRLQCGNHCCMEPCHRGHCEQCWEYSYQELMCHCGAEILYPPLPCGTRPPTCMRVCARMHSCDHPVSHCCHNEEECPPCTMLTVKMCMGEHEKRYNIPCHITEVSCGMACGKELPCGRHRCLKLCHRGVCMDSPSHCRQPCTTPRKYCSHVCGEPCHVGIDCPDVPCKAEVVLTCKCGRMKERVVCGASSSGVMQQAFHKILSKDLGAKIRDLQSGQSVSLGRVSLTSLSRDRDTLDCDEVCAQVERNKALAEALGITSPVLDPLESPLPKYPSSLLDHARRDMTFAASVEEELKSFIDLVTKGPSDQVRRHKFQPMASHERQVIHELAPHYGCESLSYDSEPLRHVTVSTKKSRAKLPALSLIKMLDKERLKVATPAPVNLPSVRGSSPARISGPLEIERTTKTPTATREPVTDYFADDMS